MDSRIKRMMLYEDLYLRVFAQSFCNKSTNHSLLLYTFNDDILFDVDPSTCVLHTHPIIYVEWDQNQVMWWIYNGNFTFSAMFPIVIVLYVVLFGFSLSPICCAPLLFPFRFICLVYGMGRFPEIKIINRLQLNRNAIGEQGDKSPKLNI